MNEQEKLREALLKILQERKALAVDGSELIDPNSEAEQIRKAARDKALKEHGIDPAKWEEI